MRNISISFVNRTRISCMAHRYFTIKIRTQNMVSPEGFEPSTPGLWDRCSRTWLSYGEILKGFARNRTWRRYSQSIDVTITSQSQKYGGDSPIRTNNTTKPMPRDTISLYPQKTLFKFYNK